MLRTYFYYHKKICQIFPLVFLLCSAAEFAYIHMHIHICDIHHLPTHAPITQCNDSMLWTGVFSIHMKIYTPRLAIAIPWLFSSSFSVPLWLFFCVCDSRSYLSYTVYNIHTYPSSLFLSRARGYRCIWC